MFAHLDDDTGSLLHKVIATKAWSENKSMHARKETFKMLAQSVQTLLFVENTLDDQIWRIGLDRSTGVRVAECEGHVGAKEHTRHAGKEWCPRVVTRATDDTHSARLSLVPVGSERRNETPRLRDQRCARR